MRIKKTTKELRDLLKEMFDAKYLGATIQRHARAQGLADGYMQAMVDLGKVTDEELVAIVSDEQRRALDRADGQLPATAQAEAFA